MPSPLVSGLRLGKKSKIDVGEDLTLVGVGVDPWPGGAGVRNCTGQSCSTAASFLHNKEGRVMTEWGADVSSEEGREE